ncbi:M12 family metallo-peptidase, partial [Candidatus Arcticimaribacter]
FTQFFGDDDDSNGTNKEDAFVQVVSTINRINEVFGIDFGVRLELVSSANLLYDDPETDPYGDDFNEEIQEVLTDSFGESNYDIGHLFDYGDANGNAGSVGNVCSNGRKLKIIRKKNLAY